MYAPQLTWDAWLRTNFVALAEGARLFVPPTLEHPASAGFKRLEIAMPYGQTLDWALPLSDGSRIHVHELRDGSFVAHRDVHDPDLGLASALKHLWSETPFGALAVFGVLAYAASR